MSKPRLPNSENMELLVSKHAGDSSSLPSMPIAVKLSFALLFFGAAGTFGCLYVMLNSDHSVVRVEELGMQRVANNWDNLLNTLAIPALMFFVLLTLYACQLIYMAYRKSRDAEKNKLRRNASKRNGRYRLGN